MRAIIHYHFLIGTRIPFSDWPGIAEKFFAKCNLSYRDFYYYFSDFDNSIHGLESACQKAVKDFPQLSPIHRSAHESGVVTLYLSNIEENSPCTQTDILTMLPKLYKKYGFVDSQLFYQNVDFFGRRLSTIRRPTQELPGTLCGSSISLDRCRFGTRWNGITVSADFVYGDEILDASAYRDAMAELLPEIRCLESVETILTPEDEALFAARNSAAETEVGFARTFFEERIPQYAPTVRAEGGAPVGPVLKRLCKKYGYTYKYDYYCHTMRKRSKNGHYIHLEVDAYSGSGQISRMDIQIQCLGLGFDHWVFSGGAPGMEQTGTAEYFKAVFQALAEAEETQFPKIEAFYPPTPEWYIP